MEHRINGFCYGSPSEVGMQGDLSERIEEYIRVKRCSRLLSCFIQKDDKVIFEKYYQNYSKEKTNPILSVVKSIISLLIGIAIKQERIHSVEDRFCTYFPEYFTDRVDPVKRQVTIQHLLTMTSGVHWISGQHNNQPLVRRVKMSSDWISTILELPQKYRPGEYFQYKEADIMLLSALIYKVTGMNAAEYADKYLFEKLDMIGKPFTIGNQQIAYNNNDHIYPVGLTTQDMAKIGQLYLNNGRWNEQEIVPEEYINASIKLNQSSNFKTYGYFLWLTGDGSFRASGWGGQTIHINQKQNLIVVLQSKSEVGRGMGYDGLIDDIVITSIID